MALAQLGYNPATSEVNGVRFAAALASLVVASAAWAGTVTGTVTLTSEGGNLESGTSCAFTATSDKQSVADLACPASRIACGVAMGVPDADRRV